MFLSTLCLQAQKANRWQKTSFTLIAGAGIRDMKQTDANGQELDTEFIRGFHFGLTAAVPVKAGFFLQPGIVYSTKGATSRQATLGGVREHKLKLGYIEMPLHLLYRSAIGKGSILFGAGPYAAIAINGNRTIEGSGTSDTRKLKFTGTVGAADAADETYFRRFDAGLDLVAGYEFGNSVLLQLIYQRGMVNARPDYELSPNDKTTAKHRGLSLSVGYAL